jgi:hypothetical protein
MGRRGHVVASALALVAAAVWAPLAHADDDPGVRAELEALKHQLAEQRRRIEELEGRAPTQDDLALAVRRYLGDDAPAALGGGADEKRGGKAGWPLGGAPFVSEGPNRINFHFRNQVRYESFHYSDDAVGTLKTPADTVSDAAPRDRSGFEIERIHLAVDGTVFCPDVSYNMVLDFESDAGGNVTRKYMFLDWRYAKDHHVRAGQDKVCATLEDQTSTGSLAFVDRHLYASAFRLDFDTGVSLWGTFGDAAAPKRFFYKVQAATGEGPMQAAGSVFGTDAFDTYSDQLLYSAMFEWNVTGKDWKHDEVDSRPCDERCRLDASLGVWAYYENDDDGIVRVPGGLALRSTGPLDRFGAGAWLRARWRGFTFFLEAGMREVEYTSPTSAAPTQTDWGAEAMLHYRLAESNWGFGARAGMIRLDDDYDTIAVGAGPAATVVSIEDTIVEYGFVVNHFFWDHGHKVSADVTWVRDNSGVHSSGPGHLWGASRGVIVEDGVMLRLQWQVNF